MGVPRPRFLSGGGGGVAAGMKGQVNAGQVGGWAQTSRARSVRNPAERAPVVGESCGLRLQISTHLGGLKQGLQVSGRSNWDFFILKVMGVGSRWPESFLLGSEILRFCNCVFLASLSHPGSTLS